MTRQFLPRPTTLVGTAVCTFCFCLCAQTSPAPSPAGKITLDETALEARAVEIREKFVHRFSTPDEISAFDHPGQKLKIKRPKLPKDGASDGETMAAMYAYAVAHQAPTQLYDGIFNSVFFGESYGDAIGSRPTAGDSIEAGAKATARLESLIPQFGTTMANRTLAKGMQAANAANETQGNDKLMKARSAAIARIAASFLSPTEADQYKAGNYLVRARLLFKAGQIALRKQPVPNAFVLMLCDPSPQNGNGSGSQVFYVYSDDLKDVGTSLPERWLTLGRLHSRFMQDGGDAFATDSPSEAFLSRLSPFLRLFNTDPHLALLGTLGDDGEKEYEAADANTRDQIKKTDMAMYIAADILIGTYASQR